MGICREITVHEAEYMLQDFSLLVLDIRSHEAYAAGHYPNAIHLDRFNLRPMLKNLAKHIPVLVYCEHGHRSLETAQVFSDFGFSSVYSLIGGYEAWFEPATQPVSSLSANVRNWLVARDFSAENLSLRHEGNETALMCAAREDALWVCDALIEAGAPLNQVNTDGCNALWVACVNGSIASAARLIEAGIDMDHQNDHGASPLMYVSSVGNQSMLELLLSHGARLDLVTQDEFSALDVAADTDTLKRLRNAHSAETSQTQKIHSAA